MLKLARIGVLTLASAAISVSLYSGAAQAAPRPPEPNTGYVQFCTNSPTLCGAATPAAPKLAFLQFCTNSPTLCGPVSPAPADTTYAQFCVNSPTLCRPPD